MTRRRRSPAEHRRRQQAAVRGDADMWANLAKLYGQLADPAADEQRRRERTP
jgi:hypothetical protein